jgi:MFS family permease
LTDIRLVIASRAVMGVALGGMITSAVALTGDYYTGVVRQRWFAIQGAAAAMTAVIAASAAGALAEADWRLPFLMLATGFALFAALIVFRGPSGGSRIEEAVELLTEEATRPAPRRTLAVVFLLGVLASLTLFPPAYAIGVLLEEKALGSAMLTGVMTSVLAAGAVLGALGLGLLRTLSLPLRQAVAFAVAAAGTAATWASSGLALFMIGAFAVGIAQGMTSPVLSEWLLNETPLRLRGRVVGLFQTTFFLAQFASPLLAQAVAKALGSTTQSMLYYAAACALQFVAIAAVRTSRRAVAPSAAV